jgi:hypothetical protein
MIILQLMIVTGTSMICIHSCCDFRGLICICLAIDVQGYFGGMMIPSKKVVPLKDLQKSEIPRFLWILLLLLLFVHFLPLLNRAEIA